VGPTIARRFILMHFKGDAGAAAAGSVMLRAEVRGSTQTCLARSVAAQQQARRAIYVSLLFRHSLFIFS